MYCNNSWEWGRTYWTPQTTQAVTWAQVTWVWHYQRNLTVSLFLCFTRFQHLSTHCKGAWHEMDAPSSEPGLLAQIEYLARFSRCAHTRSLPSSPGFSLGHSHPHQDFQSVTGTSSFSPCLKSVRIILVTISCNDYLLIVALTPKNIKWETSSSADERLLPPTFNPYQFTYEASRTTENTMPFHPAE